MTLVVLALVLAACGGGDDGSPVPEARAARDASPEPVAASGGANAFCDEVAAFTRTVDGSDGIDVESTVEAMEAIAGSAPRELAGDVALLVEANRAYAEFIRTGAEMDIDEPAVEAAGARVDTYIRDVCGIDVDDAQVENDLIDSAFATQTGTLELSGAVDASEAFADLDVECTQWEDGELWVSLLPEDDGWSIVLNVAGSGALATGDHDAYHVVVSPPFTSALADEGAVFFGSGGTLTVTAVGAAEQLEGETLLPVAGTFAAELVNELDPEATLSASGTFTCSAYVLGS